MEENNVLESVVENPVVPEVVKDITAPAVTAIEPTQVPQINIQAVDDKKFLGFNAKTWTDIGVMSAAVGTGVFLDRAIPWLFGKVKNGVKATKAIIDAAKNSSVNLNNVQQPAPQPTPVPNPEPAPAPQPTPDQQENK